MERTKESPRSFQPLLGRMQELKDLSGVIGLLTWDQETYLPPRADAARAAQLSTLQGLYHERLIDPRLGELLEEARAGNHSEDEQAMVRVLCHERDRAIRVPGRLVRELAEAQSQGLVAWREARKEKRFAGFQPALSRLIGLRREMADALVGGISDAGERYDALLEAYEPGMRVSRLTPVLERLRDQLVPMVAAIGAQPQPLDVFEGKTFDTEAQWRFTLKLLEAMGFDLQAGRQDKSIHPFTGGTHPRDVRLTTRLDPDTPLPALFGTIHEGGHGLYEQGFAEAHHRTPLASTPSMGLHESQSRLWENIVGRSHAFWSHFLPPLQGAFVEELGNVSLDQFLKSVNRVAPSLIRVEADEVTYNLHVVLRYELELALMRDELPLAELPAAWNEKVKRYLGLTPENDLVGVLQDIHWAWGEFGYFPTYALGNLYSASLYEAAQRDLPDLEERIREGDLLGLRDWLRARVHNEGYRYPAETLIQKVTGQGLTDTDFIHHLKTKYGALYRVSL